MGAGRARISPSNGHRDDPGGSFTRPAGGRSVVPRRSLDPAVVRCRRGLAVGVSGAREAVAAPANAGAEIRRPGCDRELGGNPRHTADRRRPLSAGLLGGGAGERSGRPRVVLRPGPAGPGGRIAGHRLARGRRSDPADRRLGGGASDRDGSRGGLGPRWRDRGASIRMVADGRLLPLFGRGPVGRSVGPPMDDRGGHPDGGIALSRRRAAAVSG